MEIDPSLLDQLDAAVLAAHSQQQMAENFASSIKKFISSIEDTPNTSLSMSNLCHDFHFQRRRFYDVINVLEALEFCKKTGVDELVWFGREKFKKLLLQMKNEEQTDRDSHDHCISISALTLKFVKSFFTFGVQKLNIKDIGKYLSKENGRMKTTVCKLYQISHILEASGVVEKTVMPGEIKLVDEYFNIRENPAPKIPFTIEQLLNTPVQPKAPINTESGLIDNELFTTNLSI